MPNYQVYVLTGPDGEKHRVENLTQLAVGGADGG